MSCIRVIPIIVDNVVQRIHIVAKDRQIDLNAFARGYKTSIYDAEKAIKKVISVIESAVAGGCQLVFYNWRGWLRATRKYANSNFWHNHNIFDIVERFDETNVEALIQYVISVEPKPWMNVYANAAIAYERLEQSPILVDGFRYTSVWDYNSYSGRSKSHNRPLQNLEEGTFIADPNNPARTKIITVDWKAADLIVAAYLSGDAELVQRIIDVDIYTEPEFKEVAETRQGIKTAILSSLYKADSDALAALSFKLAEWIHCQMSLVKENSEVKSCFDRVFRKGTDRSELSVFNAQIQGCIALAMMNIVPKVQLVSGSSMLFETHDAITVAASPEMAAQVLKNVCKIMYTPFKDFMTISGMDVIMPVSFVCGDRYGSETVGGTFENGKIKLKKAS